MRFECNAFFAENYLLKQQPCTASFIKKSFFIYSNDVTFFLNVKESNNTRIWCVLFFYSTVDKNQTLVRIFITQIGIVFTFKMTSSNDSCTMSEVKNPEKIATYVCNDSRVCVCEKFKMFASDFFHFLNHKTGDLKHFCTLVFVCSKCARP